MEMKGKGSCYQQLDKYIAVTFYKADFHTK